MTFEHEVEEEVKLERFEEPESVNPDMEEVIVNGKSVMVERATNSDTESPDHLH